MKPIYCIEEYEYFNPYGSNSENHDSIMFLIILSCREGTVQLDYHSLHDMVDACKKHEPRLYHYLQNLLADMEEFYNSETRLIRALERDGFDVSRLLYAFFDNADMEHIANWIKKHGKNQVRRTAEEIQKSMTEDDDEDDDALLEFGEFLGKKTEVIRKVYEAMKALALDYLPTLNLLETGLVRSFNTRLNYYALMMVDMAVSKWEQLEEEDYDEDDEDDPSTLEGRRQFYLNYRRDHPVEGCESSPIFCVDIMDFVEEWESKGWNHVRVWYKLTCAEGEWYHDIDFEYLIEEAMLYFPDIYADAMKYYKASSSPRPRDPAMLHGLKRKGHDLTPVLASYLASREDFMPDLREENRLKSVFPDKDYLSYEGKRRWEDEMRNPLWVEEFQLVNLLRDGLVTEGIAVILRELPEFHIRAPKSFLDYMEHWAFHDYIDPINDLSDELKGAFALRRGYKTG